MKKYQEQILGKRIGRLVVIEALSPQKVDKRLLRYYKCQCDCGTFKEIRLDSLKPGGTKSCGCLQKEIATKLGHQTFVKLPKGQKPRKDLISIYKRSARKRDILFELSEDEFFHLVGQRCHYCDCQPNKQIKNPRFDDDYFVYNGIDRIDSNKSYNIQNCVPCCSACNYAKGWKTQEEFLDLVRKIYIKNYK